MPKPGRSQFGEFLCQSDGGFIGSVEKGAVIREPLHLRIYGIDNLLPPITDVDTPKARKPIEKTLAFGIRQVATLSRNDDMRPLRMHFEVVGKWMEMKRSICVLQLSQRLLLHEL